MSCKKSSDKNVLCARTNLIHQCPILPSIVKLSFHLSLSLLHAGWQGDRPFQRPVQDLCHLWRHPQDGECLVSFLFRHQKDYLTHSDSLLSGFSERSVGSVAENCLRYFHCKKTACILQVVKECAGLGFLCPIPLKPSFYPLGGVWRLHSQAGQNWRRCCQVSKVRCFYGKSHDNT